MNQEQNYQDIREMDSENGITIKDIFFIIHKHILAIILILGICLVGGYAYTRFEKPSYTSTGTMLVSYEGNNNSISSDYTFSSYIANTFVVFITQDIVMDVVSQKTGVSTAILKKNTSVKNSSLIISVTYTCDDASDAQEVTQTIIDTAQDVADTLDSDNKPVYHLLYDNLKVLSEAKLGTKKSTTLRNLAISAALGLVLAGVFVLLNELFDNKFKSSEEVEKLLEVPLLAGIPAYDLDEKKKSESDR